VPGSNHLKGAPSKSRAVSHPYDLYGRVRPGPAARLGLVDLPEAVTRELYSGHLTPRTANWRFACIKR